MSKTLLDRFIRLNPTEWTRWTSFGYCKRGRKSADSGRRLGLKGISSEAEGFEDVLGFFASVSNGCGLNLFPGCCRADEWGNGRPRYSVEGRRFQFGDFENIRARQYSSLAFGGSNAVEGSYGLHVENVKPVIVPVNGGKANFEDLVYISVLGKEFGFSVSDTVNGVEQTLKAFKDNAKVLAPNGDRLGPGVQLGNLLFKRKDISSPLQSEALGFVIEIEGRRMAVQSISVDNCVDFASNAADTRNRLKKVESEIATMQKFDKHLEHQARKVLLRRGLIFGGYLVLQNSALAYGTWWLYSWDVMEPVCYFLNSLVIIFGGFYFCLFNIDGEYPELWKKSKMFIRGSTNGKNGFDPNLLSNLKKQRMLLTKALALKPSETDILSRTKF